MSKFLELYDDFSKNSRLRQFYTETYDDFFIYLVFLFKYMHLIHDVMYKSRSRTSIEIENLKKYLMENMENIRICIHGKKHASLNNLLMKIESDTETTILEKTDDNYQRYYKPLFMMLLHHNKLSRAEYVFMEFLPKMVLITINTHGRICVSSTGEKSCQKVMNDTDSKIILIQSASIGNVDYLHYKGDISEFIKKNFQKNKDLKLTPIKNILNITQELYKIDRELYAKSYREYHEKITDYEKNYEKKYNVQIINRGEYYLNKTIKGWLDADEIDVINENSTNDFDVYSLMSKQVPDDGIVKLSDIINFFNSKRVKYIVIFDFTCSRCDADTSTAENDLVSKKRINYKPEIQKLLESETPEVLKMSYNTPERDKKEKIETKIKTAEAESSILKDKLDELTREFKSEKNSYPIEHYNLKIFEGESNRDFLLKIYELERLKIEKKIFEINLNKHKKYENYESLKIQKEEEIQKKKQAKKISEESEKEIEELEKQIEESEKQIEELDKRIEESEKQIKKFNEESKKQENALFKKLSSLEIGMKNKLSRFDETLKKINEEKQIISRSLKQINEVRIKKISDILIRFKSYLEDLKKKDKPIKIKDIRLFNHDDLTHIKSGVNLLRIMYHDIIIIYSRFIVDFMKLYDRCINNIFRFISGVQSVTTEESFEKDIEPDIIDEIYYDIYVLEYLFSGKLFNRKKLHIEREKKDYKYIKAFFEKIKKEEETRKPPTSRETLRKEENILNFDSVMPSQDRFEDVNPMIPSATSQSRIQKIYHGMRNIGNRIFSLKKPPSRGGRHTRKCRSHRRENKKLV